jgi:uroporphyrinogen decarboxylase
MPEKMTHWERVRAALEGGPVDRPPVSAWRHFFGQETSAQKLADAMLGFQRRFDWDFMKVNPRASYHTEDWGVSLTFSDSDACGHETVDWPVKNASDWETIRPLDIHQGVLGEHLQAMGIIADGLEGRVPFLVTVFTPLSIAAQLAGSEEAMMLHIRENPTQVHRALEVITETFTGFAAECLKLGAGGLFYATTKWATYDRLTDDQYAEFGRPYDLRLLEALPAAEFHVLHVCGSNNMLPALTDYPVAAFNWDTQDETNIWLKEGRKITGKAAIGGVAHQTVLLDGTPEDVAGEVSWTVDSMEGTGWMLGTGCTFPPEVPEQNLQALRNALGDR